MAKETKVGLLVVMLLLLLFGVVLVRKLRQGPSSEAVAQTRLDPKGPAHDAGAPPAQETSSRQQSSSAPEASAQVEAVVVQPDLRTAQLLPPGSEGTGDAGENGSSGSATELPLASEVGLGIEQDGGSGREKSWTRPGTSDRSATEESPAAGTSPDLQQTRPNLVFFPSSTAPSQSDEDAAAPQQTAELDATAETTGADPFGSATFGEPRGTLDTTHDEMKADEESSTAAGDGDRQEQSDPWSGHAELEREESSDQATLAPEESDLSTSGFATSSSLPGSRDDAGSGIVLDVRDSEGEAVGGSDPRSSDPTLLANEPASNPSRYNWRTSSPEMRITNSPPTAPPTALISETTYTVAPNDNFWKISVKQYGKGRYFKALERYNETLGGNVQLLHPGDRIQVPSLGQLEELYPELTGASTRSALPGSESADESGPPGAFLSAEGHKMYRVKSTDNLFRIAKSTLGRGARWREIYELNRDRIADPDRLKPGMVIRLPDSARVERVAGGTPSLLQ